jgi:DNA-binding NarL/FixJ family response regulator
MSISPDSRTAVIVDRHPLWLDTVEQVVRRAGVEVVAKDTSPLAVLSKLADLQPSLLITGMTFAADEPDGLTLVQNASDRVPGLKVIVLSAHEDQQHIDAAFAAGASAYVVKTVHADDLTSAVRQAFMNSIFLAGARAAHTSSAHAPAAIDDSPGLTRRELEILRLVSEGHSNAQLARMLWVTEQTVKFHLSNIYRKLDVANRTEASRWAQLQGLLATSGSSEQRLQAVG